MQRKLYTDEPRLEANPQPSCCGVTVCATPPLNCPVHINCVPELTKYTY